MKFLVKSIEMGYVRFCSNQNCGLRLRLEMEKVGCHDINLSQLRIESYIKSMIRLSRLLERRRIREMRFI